MRGDFDENPLKNGPLSWSIKSSVEAQIKKELIQRG